MSAPTEVKPGKILSPNGVIVPTREFARKLLEGKAVDGRVSPYVSQDHEVQVVRAAIRVGLPIALCGSHGMGKTTLIANIAKGTGLPMVTVMGDKVRAAQLLGEERDFPDGSIEWKSGLVDIVVRANYGILFIDEFVNMRADALTSISNLLDDRKKIALRETGEELDALDVVLVAAFNPPPSDMRVSLPTPATFDRFVMWKWGVADPVGTLLKMYDAIKAGNTSGIKVDRMSPDEVLDKEPYIAKKHGAALGEIVKAINSEATRIMLTPYKDLEDPVRAIRNAIRLIVGGLEPRLAAMAALVYPMNPVKGQEIAEFETAASKLIDTKI